MLVSILKPEGYCSGVSMAIDLAVKIKEENKDKNVYVLGMLVHNTHVTNFLKNKGIVTLDGEDKGALISTLNKGDILIFTAHGHEKHLDNLAKEKGLIIYDSVCPKVKHNLTLIQKEIDEGHQVIYIGKNKHPEAVGALSISSNVLLLDNFNSFDFNKIIDNSPLVINQTTLNVLELENIFSSIKEIIPNARITNEICNTTRLRQEAIINLDKTVDALLIVGDKKSSNTNRLYDIALLKNPDLHIQYISSIEELNINSLKNKNHIAISSGASTPSDMINKIYNLLKQI